MNQLKIVSVYDYESIFQATLRQVSLFMHSIEEQNIIEFYSLDFEKIIKMIRENPLFFSKKNMEVIEIGMAPILSNSLFVSLKELVVNNEIQFDQLNMLYHLESQIWFVQVEKKNMIMIHQLLPMLMTKAQHLQLLIFLTESNQSHILPIVNFNQIPMLSINEIVEKRKQQGKNTDTIASFFQFLYFQIVMQNQFGGKGK
ncbi:hypothetical protein ACJX4K_001001 [Enterococcus faecalis]|uniref:Uncharacterized protein n=1 Tax=Enterococcus faecalis TaxID=1351 RepID=A0A8B3RVY2_ENTFL|nr:MULTISPECIES: hypothetical protein [Enterococcus]EGO2696601.1 hypothetical protein [Enterococcus faecalis]EGO2801704.1 hypothetical protein [Enterococcus faecalis]EGO2812917.1 hypothetical protein [Enterococcus faecalis]EGO2830262.1 hypothetical protein [Enterococcus faecalis]EGO5040771.1 hypothetical protein [Enterococcus faecalis]